MRRLVYLFAALGRIPSVVYAVIYLTVIPLFAVIYSALPNHFYQATLTIENRYHGIDFNNQAELIVALQEGIQDAVRQAFVDHYGTRIATSRNVRLNIDDLTVSDIFFDDRENKVVIEFACKAEVNHSLRPYFVTLFFYADEYSILKGGSREFAYLSLGYHDPTKKEALPVPLEYVFPSESGFYAYTAASNHSISNAGTLRVNRRLYHDLNALVHNLNGSASYSQFIRMLYFSVVTITTLGFGDIVPISSTARTLVACESVSGVILIGLFLNSLSYKVKGE